VCVCVCVCVCTERIERTIEIEKKYMEIEERGVKLRLTVVDTPGFNDAVDARHWYAILVILLPAADGGGPRRQLLHCYYD